MAFIANKVEINKKEEPSKAPLSNSNLNLTKEDIELLLLTIREMNFKGEHIERVYTVVYKLQQYYMSFNR
jgi:hypothetical protein